jgi:hypothetical protein
MREKLLEDYQNGRFTILPEWDEQGKKMNERELKIVRTGIV